MDVIDLRSGFSVERSCFMPRETKLFGVMQRSILYPILKTQVPVQVPDANYK